VLRDFPRSTAVAVSEDDRYIAEIRVELDLIRDSWGAATVSGDANAVDDSCLESISVSTAIVSRYDPGSDAIDRFPTYEPTLHKSISKACEVIER
jgi:hypothetical protein